MKHFEKSMVGMYATWSKVYKILGLGKSMQAKKG